MTKKSGLTILPLLLLLTFLFPKGIIAQREADTDAVPDSPPAMDSSYLNEEDFGAENKQDYEDSIRRAKANAFELLDTLNNTPAQERTLNSSFVQKIKSEPAFSYVETGIPKPVQKQKTKPFINTGNIILIIAIMAFVVFLGWYLSENDLLFFQKKSKTLSALDAAIDEKDIFSINYTDAIHKALLDANYRLAIRLRYLQLLKRLADKGLIKYQPDKTNFDYLQQLKPTNFYGSFQNITRNYEYSWYGLFNIDENKYNQITGSFSDFEKNIGR